MPELYFLFTEIRDLFATDSAKSTTTTTTQTLPCTSPDLAHRSSLNEESQHKSLSRNELTRSVAEFSSLSLASQALPKLLGGSCAEILADPSYNGFLLPKVQ